MKIVLFWDIVLMLLIIVFVVSLIGRNALEMFMNAFCARLKRLKERVMCCNGTNLCYSRRSDANSSDAPAQ